MMSMWGIGERRNCPPTFPAVGVIGLSDVAYASPDYEKAGDHRN